MDSLKIHTKQKNELVNITKDVLNIIHKSNKKNGIVLVYTPHTTAAITVNENADPDVKTDILKGLEVISPNRKEYLHYENNSDAHIKSSLLGVSQSFILNEGSLVLGTWQGIYFCEFDGPRTRTVHVKII